MEKVFGLNLIEDEEFKNIISTLPKDPKIQELCLKYYTQFKKQQSSIQSDKITLYLKCAYFLAEKSQWIQNLKGEKVRNAGLSLNDLLKKHSLEDIMITLKQYSKRIAIEDPQTLDDLQKLIKEISFLISFYRRFEKILSELHLKDKNPNYAQTLSEFVWLLYIECKNKILNRSQQLINNHCMLAYILCFVLIYSWDYHQPGCFEGLHKSTSRKEINNCIKQKIRQLFKITKNNQSYDNNGQRFEAYFSYLQQKGVIRMTQGKDDFLSLPNLQNNYKRLDQWYQTKLDYNYLDERIFFKDRTANITPSKFTPFARQKMHIPANRPKLGGNIGGLTDRSQQGSYMSHRILSYQTLETQVESTQPQVPPSEIKFPKNIMQTPLNTTTPLIQQTPYTTGIMMYNYVNELSARLQHKKFQKRDIDGQMFSIIDQVLEQTIKDENQRGREIKRNLVFSVFKVVSEDFLSVYPMDEENKEYKEIMKGLLLISFQIVFFVSNIDVGFDKLQKQVSLGQISLWRSCDFFLKFDKSMPANLKVHLLDLQVQIVSQKIWKNYQTIAKIQNFLNNEKNSKDQDLIQKLCKRLLHQIAFQIVQLCKNLSLENKQQQEIISQISFDIMKEVLLNHPYMIWQNNIDQIIMCAIFSICRAYKLQVKFQQLREAYLTCNAHLSDAKKLDIFINIEYGNENGQTQNKGIVGFYNSCFLVVMNQFVKSKCQNYTGTQTQRSIPQKDVNVLLQSPISGIIPKQINYGIKKVGGTNKMLPMKTNTPRLHAYTQSPLLKNDLVIVKNPINSRKAINFEETEKMLSVANKKQPLNQTCKLYQQNTQTNTFFNKKFSTIKTNKMCSQTPALVKSPCNNQTKSPSPSPRMNNTVVKQVHSNIYYTKRDFGKNINNYL